jgi:hypothetical protein
LPFHRYFRRLRPGLHLLTRRWQIVGIAAMVANLAVGGCFAELYKRGCVFKGKRYFSGESLGLLDGCNGHWCDDGHILSTLKGCLKLHPERECSQMTDGIHTADWRSVEEFHQQYPGVQGPSAVEFLRMADAGLHWDFHIRASAFKATPMFGLVWVLKDDCQSGWAPECLEYRRLGPDNRDILVLPGRCPAAHADR